MSQVFVSCAYRDRVVGEQVSGLLSRLGDEPVDDRDDANGTAWWNEVVGRIETCEVFVAVVSPAYADAHSCRLAAKHAAASGLPVVRLDLGDKPPTTGLHPVVRTAHRVAFDPEDPTAVTLLDRALDTALDPTVAPDESPAPRPRQLLAPPEPEVEEPVDEEPPDEEPPAADPLTAEPVDRLPRAEKPRAEQPWAAEPPAAQPAPPPPAPPSPSAPPSLPPPPPPAVPPPPPPSVPPHVSVSTASVASGDGRFSGYELALAAVMCFLALVLLVVEGRAVLHLLGVSGDAPTHQGGRVLGVTTGAQDGSGGPSAAAPSGPTQNTSGGQAPSPAAVLALVAAANSEGLPASSCAAGDDHVTCRDAAPNLQAVVLTPYSSSTALYDAYTDAVRAVSGDPAPENVGDCSGQVFEGETSWNLDLGHRTDISTDAEAAGGLDPASEAAGRIFCTESSDVIKLIWTQDPGLLVTATGQPANQTIGWWHQVHVDLACAAGGTGKGCAGQTDEQG